jgi:hypothetical protein
MRRMRRKRKGWKMGERNKDMERMAKRREIVKRWNGA